MQRVFHCLSMQWPGVGQHWSERLTRFFQTNWIISLSFSTCFSSLSACHPSPSTLLPFSHIHTVSCHQYGWLNCTTAKARAALCKTSQCWGVICSRSHSSLCPLSGVSCAKCGLRSLKPVRRSTGVQDAPDPGPPRHWHHFTLGGMQLIYWPGPRQGTFITLK